MRPRTLCPSIAVVLTLLASQGAAQVPFYSLGGTGTATDTSSYQVVANLDYTTNPPKSNKGGIHVQVIKGGKTVFYFDSEKDSLPHVTSTDPNLASPPVPVWGYVNPFTVNYSIGGRCGQVRGAGGVTTLQVTATATSVTVQCPSGQPWSGKTQSQNPIKLRRTK